VGGELRERERGRSPLEEEAEAELQVPRAPSSHQRGLWRPLQLDDSPLEANDRRVPPVVGLEFRKNALDPALDCVFSHAQPIGNLLVRGSVPAARKLRLSRRWEGRLVPNSRFEFRPVRLPAVLQPVCELSRTTGSTRRATA
jgi:hypothetical protein